MKHVSFFITYRRILEIVLQYKYNMNIKREERGMLEKTEKRHRIKKETFLQGVLVLMVSQVLIKILGLVQTLYLTNRKGFGDTGNAIYMGGYQIYALLLSISSIGIPNAISKLVSEKLAIGDKEGAHRVFKIAIFTFGVIGMIGTLLLFFSADVVSRLWLGIPESKVTLMILSPGVFFVAISSVFRGYFNGRAQMSATANAQTFEQFWKTLLTIVFVELAVVLTSTNTVYMAAAATAATSMAIIFSFIYLYKYYIKERQFISTKNDITVKRDNRTFKAIVKSILWISIPISLSAILSSLNKIVDSTTVVNILSPILGETVAKTRYGILSAKVDILVALPLAFNVAFATALVPAISAANAKRDTITINKRISFSILVSILIGLPCTVGMFMYAKEILLLLFPFASDGGVLLAIMSFTIIITLVEQTINGVLQGFGKVKTPVVALTIGIVAKIIANVVLIPIEGIYENGAAIGSIVGHGISLIIVYAVLRKTVKLDFSLIRLSIKPILATLIMAGCSYGVFVFVKSFIGIRISTIIAIIIAVIVFAIAVVILKIFSKEEIEMLPKGDKVYSVLKKLHLYS